MEKILSSKYVLLYLLLFLIAAILISNGFASFVYSIRDHVETGDSYYSNATIIEKYEESGLLGHKTYFLKLKTDNDIIYVKDVNVKEFHKYDVGYELIVTVDGVQEHIFNIYYDKQKYFDTHPNNNRIKL